MDYDVNGWSVLAEIVKEIPGSEGIVQDILGERASFNNIAMGNYILSGTEISKLFDLFRMEGETRFQMLDRVITCRKHCRKLKIDSDLCRLFSDTVQLVTAEIPCIRFSGLSKFRSKHESLTDFMSREQEKTVKMFLPQGACALELTGAPEEIMLELPENTLLIVDGSAAGTPGETALYQYYNGRFSLGKLPDIPQVCWSAPVLRIHFRQWQNSTGISGEAGKA